MIKLKRNKLKEIEFSRFIKGGRTNDIGRLPRYLLTMGFVLIGLWAFTTLTYIAMPRSYTSQFTMFIPGTGQSTSMTLDNIGQAATYSASPFASNRVSPTENYKKLLQTDRVKYRAAIYLDQPVDDFPDPSIKLVDSTNFIGVKISSNSPDDAFVRALAVYNSFQQTLTDLRQEEIQRRSESFSLTLVNYKKAVATSRHDILSLQSTAGLVSIDQYNELLGHVADLERDALGLKADLSEHQAKITALCDLLDLKPQYAAATLKLKANTEFQTLLETYNEQLVIRTISRRKYGKNHPERLTIENSTQALDGKILSLGSQITSIPTTTIRKLVDFSTSERHADKLNELLSIVVTENGVASKLATITAQISDQKLRIKGLVETAAQLDDLNRNHQIAEAVFSSAIARNDTSKSDVFTAYPLIQLIETPTLADKPSNPSLKITLVLSFISSFCVIMMFTIAWLRRPLIDMILSDADA